MNHRLSSAALLFLLAAGLASAQLQQVHAVYLLPMAGGLDQYLATRLVEMHLFQVVTDPKLADAVFAGRIGEDLEDKLAELYPDEKKDSSKDKDKDKDKNEFAGSSSRVGNTNLQRGKGTIFLVDRRTHTVLWSLYSPGKSSSAADVNRNAGAIAKKLEAAVKGTKQ